MFDPTAFDNMKVVIEGVLYDRDISGEIVITDRNDLLNMAKMSRQFDVSIRLPHSSVIVKMELKSDLHNLAAELLPNSLSDHHAGCYLNMQFFLEHDVEIDYQSIVKILRDIWGATRKISLSVHKKPLEPDKSIKTVITLVFDRLITEDQLDDLVEMTDFLVITLEKLNKAI
ncbi:hypothetical protein FAY30_15565 [Bacillus sp. S3]|uniref:hypothetical protein n=1 Tax=Bacillus sp. S3 TaxID=486398 RepID=UPI00118CF7CD|nr:hypothetical protein [Bacillus sp. S3]QCJ43205.1 hypothetical protein FAY30_15565 [Bacillus sp. S3]